MHIVSTRNRTDNDVNELANKSRLYKTLSQCSANGLFAEGSPVRAFTPAECLGGELEEVKVLHSELSEAGAASLVGELAEEVKKLNKFVGKANLDVWYEAVFANVRREVEQDLGNETEDMELE